MLGNLIQKLINWMDIGDYFFIVTKSNEYNTTGKTELHNIDSIEPILTGDFTIIRALIRDYIDKKFYY